MPKRLTLPLAAAAALLAPAAVLAQTTVASLLPETTVLALHLSPEGVDTSTLGSLVDDLDLERAAASARSLAALFDEAAVGGALHDAELPVDPLEELAVTCPDLAAALEAAADSFGPTVLGVSLSRFDPVPDVVAVTRPEEHDVAARLVVAAADCLDGTSLGREGDAELYLLADGAELPFVVAESDGFLVASTDPELARGALRRAQGSREPGFADTRLGALSTSLTARGLGATLNLAAAADAVELYRGILGEAPEAGPLLDRFVTTLRALGGFAWHVSVDAGGLVVESVSAFDSRLAAEAGEDELLALLACRGCELSGPELLPRDAVGLSGGVFSASALVAWVDSWLADAREAGLVGDAAPGSLEGLLGVDLGDLLLDWVGDSWSAAWLDVLATDARPWLQGLPAVVTVPVTSEDEARRGVELWLDTLASLAAAGEEIVVEAGADGGLCLEGAVAVRERSYRGVDYLRLRSGPTLDLGVAVFGGHLVLGWPAASLHAAVDTYLGSPSAAGVAWRTYESLGLDGDVVGYRLTDTPAFLRGLARVSDLAAGPLATAGWLAARGAAEAYGRDGDGDGMDGASGAEPGDLPTYDDLVTLADLVTETLETLADRTGVAVGTTELRGGVRWTTWRLPLR